jgi:hypothetical protein
MKSLQVTSGFGSLLLLILIPQAEENSLKMDFLFFLLIMLTTFLASSHFVGIQNKINNEKE